MHIFNGGARTKKKTARYDNSRNGGKEKRSQTDKPPNVYSASPHLNFETEGIACNHLQL